MSRLQSALIGATLLAGAAGGPALAQAPIYDPAQLPAIQGKVAQYTLTPRGDVDGLILEDGNEVHIPPYLSTQLVFAVRPGDTVTIHGLKARALPMTMAMSVTNDATHATVEAGRRMARGAALEVQGTVKAQLHSPRGELDGVLLTDGTVVRLPPPAAERIAAQLAVGQSIYARGDGTANDLGHVIAARAIGPSKDHTTEIRGAHPGWMAGGWMHGWRGMIGGMFHGGSGGWGAGRGPDGRGGDGQRPAGPAPDGAPAPRP